MDLLFIYKCVSMNKPKAIPPTNKGYKMETINTAIDTGFLGMGQHVNTFFFCVGMMLLGISLAAGYFRNDANIKQACEWYECKGYTKASVATHHVWMPMTITAVVIALPLLAPGIDLMLAGLMLVLPVTLIVGASKLSKSIVE